MKQWLSPKWGIYIQDFVDVFWKAMLWCMYWSQVWWSFRITWIFPGKENIHTLMMCVIQKHILCAGTPFVFTVIIRSSCVSFIHHVFMQRCADGCPPATLTGVHEACWYNVLWVTVQQAQSECKADYRKDYNTGFPRFLTNFSDFSTSFVMIGWLII